MSLFCDSLIGVLMSKSCLSLESIPNLVKTGIISKQQGMNFLVEEIQKNSFRYKILNNDEDLISEVILHLLQNEKNLFENFIKQKLPFVSYFRSVIKFRSMSIKRNLYKDSIRKHCSDALSELNYEETNEKYEKNEFSNKLVTFSPICPIKLKRVPYKTKRYENSEQIQYLLKKHSTLASFFKDKRSYEQKVVLIVALKASYYLSDEMLQAISVFCTIEHYDLQKNVLILKDELELKNIKYSKLEEKRDRAYHLHRYFQNKLELLKDEKKSEYEYQSILKKYLSHTKSWEKYNSFLQLDKMKICPTNKRISQLVGLCERQVGYYLHDKETLCKLQNLKEE